MSDTKLPEGETLDESGATSDDAPPPPAEKQEHDDAMKDRS